MIEEKNRLQQEAAKKKNKKEVTKYKRKEWKKMRCRYCKYNIWYLEENVQYWLRCKECGVWNNKEQKLKNSWK